MICPLLEDMMTLTVYQAKGGKKSSSEFGLFFFERQMSIPNEIKKVDPVLLQWIYTRDLQSLENLRRDHPEDWQNVKDEIIKLSSCLSSIQKRSVRQMRDLFYFSELVKQTLEWMVVREEWR